MGHVSLGKKRFEKGAAIALLLLGLFVSPVSAAASTVLPMQVLPAGTGKSCAAVTFSDVEAHVYNGNLDSFDITLSDSSYVAVSTSVDNATVGYNYVSRWAYPDGSIKMHVDLQAIRMNKDVPVAITFLSAHADENGNSITCMFNVPATIAAIEEALGGGAPSSGQEPSTSVPPPRPPTSGDAGTGEPEGTSSATSTYNPGIVAAMNSLGNLCADGGATRLWVVLLVLFALFTFTLSAQKFEANSSVRDWNIGLILAVFVGLLIFWYASAVCRTGPWAPAIATLITIVGLLYSMLKTDDSQEILLLKDGKK